MNTVYSENPGRSAFTLFELVLATAVLALLIALIGQLFGHAHATTQLTTRRMHADAQARMVFDRMALDFQGMLKRADADALFSKQPGSDKLFFYSEAPGYFSHDPAASKRSPLSLTGYRINRKYELERLGKGLTWEGAPSGNVGGSMAFLTYPDSKRSKPYVASTLAGRWKEVIGKAPDYQSEDADFHVLAESVLRLEICFQLKAGPEGESYYSNSPAHSPTGTLDGFKEVAAIVVSLAVLDSPTRLPAEERALLSQLLPDPEEADLRMKPPLLMASLWQSKLMNSSAKSPALVPAGSTVRIYQRAFYLQTP